MTEKETLVTYSSPGRMNKFNKWAMKGKQKFNYCRRRKIIRFGRIKKKRYSYANCLHRKKVVEVKRKMKSFWKPFRNHIYLSEKLQSVTTRYDSYFQSNEGIVMKERYEGIFERQDKVHSLVIKKLFGDVFIQGRKVKVAWENPLVFVLSRCDGKELLLFFADEGKWRMLKAYNEEQRKVVKLQKPQCNGRFFYVDGNKTHAYIRGRRGGPSAYFEDWNLIPFGDKSFVYSK